MTIAMIVGNGFVLDFVKWRTSGGQSWNTQMPTLWPDQPLHEDGRLLLDVMPRFKATLTNIRRSSGASDFDIFDKLVREDAPFSGFPSAANLARLEAQHYLVGALAHFHRNIVANCNIQFWPWARWLQNHAPRLACLTSFNYDIVLETCFSQLSLSAYRPAIVTQGNTGYPIHKPHGSIDFAYSENIISMPASYPLQNYVSHNDTPLSLLDISGPRARLAAEIVLPAAASHVHHYQWSQAGSRMWCQRARNVSDLIIVGLSYWECDRTELDELVDVVPSTSRVWMANPSPSGEWLEKLRKRHGPERVFQSDGPPNL